MSVTSPLRATYDTFLHFLNDNLVGIPVNPLRRDPNVPGSSNFVMNTLNVGLMNASPDVHIGIVQFSLDVVNDVELTALTWVDQIWKLLSAALMTPRFDYSTGTPEPTGTNIYWKKSATFRPVRSDLYSHYTAKLTVNNSNF